MSSSLLRAYSPFRTFSPRWHPLPDLCYKFAWVCGDSSKMISDVTEGEFSQLETRVAIVEREVDGEKLVTRHILEQTRHNGDDLAAILGRLDRIEQRLNSVDLAALAKTVGSLERKLDGLTKNLPKLVEDAVREALRERSPR